MGVLEIIVEEEGVGEGFEFLFDLSSEKEEYHKSTGTITTITATTIKTSAIVLVIACLDDKSLRLIPLILLL
jgi:hypothetical protein